MIPGHALALVLGLAHAELFRDEAVLYDLVNILFLGKWAFTADIEITHLLADVRLVHVLRVVTTNVSMAD